MFKLKGAQIISEYALLISIVIIIMVTMFTLVKRSTQKLPQLGADQIGLQMNADQDYTSNKGFMINQTIQSISYLQRDTLFRPGDRGYGYNDSANVNTLTYSNQGFTATDSQVVTNSTVDLPTVTLP